MSEPGVAMTRRDFAAWIKRCGVELREEHLGHLERGGVVRLKGGEYTRAHLLVAVRYDEAVRVPRHAWSSEEESEVDLGGVEAIMACVERVWLGDAEAKEALTRELEGELARKDPFGPLAQIVDVLRADVVEQMRGMGRLYVELRGVALELAAELESVEEGVDEARVEESPGEPAKGPATVPVSDPMEFGEDEDVLEALSEIVGDEDEEILLVEESEVVGGLEVEDDRGAKALEADDAVSVPPPTPASALKKSSTDQDNPFMRGEVRATAKTESLKSRLEALKAPAVEAPSPLMDESPMALGEGEEWVEQETVAMDPVKLEGVGLSEMTQEATQSHMDERLSLERRIERLNARRQEFLTAQNWAGLVKLYEEGLELFEGEERAQVLLMVARLYAAKLGEVERGVEFLGRAWEMRGEAESARNALGLAEKLASRGGASALAWLESVREDGDTETHEAWVRALSASGERERALMTWGAYLAEERGRTSRKTLKTLEALSMGAQDDVVEGLYEDLLEQAGERSRGVVSVSAAKVARGRGDDVAWTLHLEGALEMGEDVWGEYAEICQRLKMRRTWETARVRWGGAFEDKDDWPEVEGVAGEDEAVLWEARVERDAADWRAVSMLSTIYQEAGRWAERYALLNRSVQHVDSDEDRVGVYLSMARIAVEHLEAPDEAAIHYARVIEIVPDHPEAHEGLQSLGA